MKIICSFFSFLFCAFSVLWLLYIRHDIINTFSTTPLKIIGIISGLYLLSHIFRIIRLAIITLDDRQKIISLATIHILTSLPVLLIPFKLGEIIRLIGFFYVFRSIKKSLTIWFVERLSDIIILIFAIFLLYIAGISISFEMKFIFITFLIISILFLVSLYSISRTFIYLNRFLVLTSRSKRGLILLKISHIIWEFELSIKRVISDRKSAIFLVSTIIWILEISALSTYLQNSSEDLGSYGRLFATSLFNSLGNQITNITSGFGLYQSMLLSSLTILISFIIFTKKSNKAKKLK